jgi:hypothetical protein
MGGIALPEGGTKARGTQRLRFLALLDLWVQPQLLLTQTFRLRGLQELVLLALLLSQVQATYQLRELRALEKSVNCNNHGD